MKTYLKLSRPTLALSTLSNPVGKVLPLALSLAISAVSACSNGEKTAYPPIPETNSVLRDPSKRVPARRLAGSDLTALTDTSTRFFPLGLAGPHTPLDGLKRRRRQHDARHDDENGEERFGDDVGRQRRQRRGMDGWRGVQGRVLMRGVDAVGGRRWVSWAALETRRRRHGWEWTRTHARGRAGQRPRGNRKEKPWLLGFWVVEMVEEDDRWSCRDGDFAMPRRVGDAQKTA